MIPIGRYVAPNIVMVHSHFAVFYAMETNSGMQLEIRVNILQLCHAIEIGNYEMLIQIYDWLWHIDFLNLHCHISIGTAKQPFSHTHNVANSTLLQCRPD